jgi:toxin ParE1/3/4
VKPIVFHPQAEEEFDEAIAFYEDRRPGVGLRFRTQVEAGLARIRRLPQSCPRYKDTDYRKCVIRKFPFSLYYMELDEAIWIAAVAHGKRRPDYWLHRRPK